VWYPNIRSALHCVITIHERYRLDLLRRFDIIHQESNKIYISKCLVSFQGRLEGHRCLDILTQLDELYKTALISLGSVK